MISSFIILLELGLFSLLLLLAFRVLSLTRSEPLISGMGTNARAGGDTFAPRRAAETAPNRTHPRKSELISQLHILASLQDRDCKQQNFDLESAHQSVREFAVCWLYGAACELSEPRSRNEDAIAMIVSQFASRKIGIRQSEALSAISTLTRTSAALACFRSGIEGAEFWKTHHFVPREKSLFEAVTSNAFV